MGVAYRFDVWRINLSAAMPQRVHVDAFWFYSDGRGSAVGGPTDGAEAPAVVRPSITDAPNNAPIDVQLIERREQIP